VAKPFHQEVQQLLLWACYVFIHHQSAHHNPPQLQRVSTVSTGTLLHIMYKKSKPTSFSSVLIIKLSIKHQHQDTFSRTSSALAYSTQLAAGSNKGLQHTHKMNRFNFWSCTKKVSGKLKYQKFNLENTVLNFPQSLIV